MKHLILTGLILSAFIFGCKKKETTTSPDPAAPSTTGGGTTTGGSVIDINSVPQATFVLDGVSKSYVSDDTNIYGGSGSGSNNNDDYVYSSDIGDGNSITYIAVSKGKLQIGGLGGPPSDAVFKAFFPTGSKPYSVGAANGIEISITDALGTEWNSSFGTANQTGSTFNILETVDNPDLLGNFYLKVKATFSCKVYDGAGNSKTITNGLYIGDFGNF
jgi:hypothetical protein